MATIKKVRSLTDVEAQWFTVTLANAYSFNIQFVCWPTQNCQVFSVSPFQYFLDHRMKPEEVAMAISEMKKVLSRNSPLLLVDVGARYENKLNDFNLVMKSPYTSSNGSKMIIALIKI